MRRPPPFDPNRLVKPSEPREARGGIKARSETGEFGMNWWAKCWIRAMERLVPAARLQRGQSYARSGQVLSLDEISGGISAKVQGSRARPYKVTIQVAPLNSETWEKVLDVLSNQAIFAAQLLAGQMPSNIEEAFSTAGASLFPNQRGDLSSECSCPDWANPCKHIAATHYILGDRFDEDPFLLFRMRGRSQQEILDGLEQRRGSTSGPEDEEIEVEEKPAELLEARISDFWEAGVNLKDFNVNILPPKLELPLIKRLGQPDFTSRYALEEMLGPAYTMVSQAARFLAFADFDSAETDNNE
jgi:uncharacterized Zn finger protein